MRNPKAMVFWLRVEGFSWQERILPLSLIRVIRFDCSWRAVAEEVLFRGEDRQRRTQR